MSHSQFQQKFYTDTCSDFGRLYLLGIKPSSFEYMVIHDIGMDHTALSC